MKIYMLFWGGFLFITGCHVAKQQLVIVPPTPEHPDFEVLQPIVNTRLTAYPQISYKPNDTVTVSEAAGCVNSGGSGRTWKDYRSPQGANSARLYHGLIWIPGATDNGVFVPVGTSPMRIDGVVGHSYVISSRGWTDAQLHIYLGYEDDYYPDNGYYKDSAGATDDQCKPVQDSAGNWRIPRAHVTIRVERNLAGSETFQHKPFDLVSSDLDPNQVLKNPIWWIQREGALTGPKPDPSHLPDAMVQCGAFPSLPAKRTHGFALCKDGCSSGKCECTDPCSSQSPSYDYPIDFSINKWLSCFGNPVGESLNGHANWAPVTYTGSLWWGGEQPFDEDADIFMRRPAGNTTNNFDWSGFSSSYDEEIEIEMAGYETWDSFGTEWFAGDWNAHNKGDPLGTEAQVIGLMSLDCVHGCKVELHPVFAIAVHVSGPTLLPDGSWDDVWALFARNWGNEGWCSHDQHYLDRDRVKFLLPGPQAATGVSVITSEEDANFENKTKTKGSTEFKANVKGVSVAGPTIIPGQGANITLILGDPSGFARVNGYLHLRWTAPSTNAVAKVAAGAPSYKDSPPETELGNGAPPRTAVKPDDVPITRISDDTVALYVPTAKMKTIVAEQKNQQERNKLKAWCKQHTSAAPQVDICHPNGEPNTK